MNQTLSPVESWALGQMRYELAYPPEEKAAVITVSDFPSLGRLTALRFVEWVQQHPEGVVSLPTGKTPEHFIAWTKRILGEWDAMRELTEAAGLAPECPTLRGLRFVQIDEFYPMSSAQANSFHAYVSAQYLEGFGLDPARSLLIDGSAIGLPDGEDLSSMWPDGRVDLTLRTRAAASNLERRQKACLQRIDDWCAAYEESIRGWGGIGFFLGGIGPDGHIGFNVSGSDPHGTTRLCPINYPTQAAAAGDLGGIEIARERHVITIGLQTITTNPDCVAIIMAAGEAKAKIVRAAIEGEVTGAIPASALRRLPGLRFFLTEGAARRLHRRRVARIEWAETVSPRVIERAMIDYAVRNEVRLIDIRDEAAVNDTELRALAGRGISVRGAAENTHEELVRRIERGAAPLSGTRFLHTEPHHDDLMLGYLPAIIRAIRDSSNGHSFVTFTSGFTAVTNAYLIRRLQAVYAAAECDLADRENSHVARSRDVWQYLDGVAAANAEDVERAECRRLARDLRQLSDCDTPKALRGLCTELIEELRACYPGQKDAPRIQRLKGMCREWEVECLWGYFGWDSENIHHLRLAFYTGDFFTPEPTREADANPIRAMLQKLRPDVVSVALDPEASGPDTHYKCLQAANEALQAMDADDAEPTPRVWGYRNVWYRFHPSEANRYVPVSLNMFSLMREAFLTCFASQRTASFPSPDHDGPFCNLAQQIQVEQYNSLAMCLGRDWFQQHPSPLIRATRGFVFIKELTAAELAKYCRRLHSRVVGTSSPSAGA